MVLGIEKIGPNRSLKQLKDIIKGVFEEQLDEKLEKDADIKDIYEKLKSVDTAKYEITDTLSFDVQKIIDASINDEKVTIKRTKYFKNIQEELTKDMLNAYNDAEKGIRALRNDYVERHIGKIIGEGGISDNDSIERCSLDTNDIFKNVDYRKKIEERCDFRKIRQDGKKFIEKENEIKKKIGYALFMIIKDKLSEQFTNLQSNIDRGYDFEGVKKRIKDIESIYKVQVIEAIKVFMYDRHIITQPQKTTFLTKIDAVLKDTDNRFKWMGLEGTSQTTKLESLLEEDNLKAFYTKVDTAVREDLCRIEQYRVSSSIYKKIADELTNLAQRIKDEKTGTEGYLPVISSLEAQAQLYTNKSAKYAAVETFLKDIFDWKEDIVSTLAILSYLIKETSKKSVGLIKEGITIDKTKIEIGIRYLIEKGFIKEEPVVNKGIYFLNKEDKELYSIASRIIPCDIKEKFGLNFDVVVR